MRGRDVWIVALLSCGIGAGCARTQAKPPEPNPDEVLVTLPITDEVTDYEEFIGRTDAMFSVEVRARVNGYLDRVNFNDGDEVEKGALLFEIDARPYKATYDQTVATLEQGNARLIRTTADHRRADALLARNAIGREEYDRIQGDFAESKASIGAAKALLDMAQLNLDWTKVTAPIGGRLSRRMVDPGNLIKADETLLTTIVSLDPMYVNFDIDERTILKLRRLIAEGRLKSRQEGEVPILVGLADEAEFPHRGTINFSDNRIESTTGTLRVRGVIANPKPRLLSPGLFAKIRLPIGSAHKSIMVPETAIGTDQGRKFVYVISKAKKAKFKIKNEVTGKLEEVERDTGVATKREIEVGSSVRVGTDSAIKVFRVVTSGMKLDDTIIVSGLQRVRDKKPVLFTSAAEFDKASGAKAIADGPAAPAAPPSPIAANGPTPAPVRAESRPPDPSR
jgi:multidrug efflux system membrane fusion protein